MPERDDLASLPTGWEQARSNLVSLTAPDGSAVAWLAAEYGGNCVGFAVRGPDGWRPVLHSEGPAALRELFEGQPAPQRVCSRPARRWLIFVAARRPLPEADRPC